MTLLLKDYQRAVNQVATDNNLKLKLHLQKRIREEFANMNVPTPIPVNKPRSAPRPQVWTEQAQDSTDLIHMKWVRTLESLPGLEILITQRITKRPHIIVTKAQLLKNGLPFVFKHMEKTRSLIEHLNSIYPSLRVGTLQTHSYRRTIQVCMAYGINQQMLMMDSTKVCRHLGSNFKEIMGMFNNCIYGILYVGGELGRETFQLLRESGIDHRTQPQNFVNQFNTLVSWLVSRQYAKSQTLPEGTQPNSREDKEDTLPLIQREKISYFKEPQNLAISVQPDGLSRVPLEKTVQNSYTTCKAEGRVGRRQKDPSLYAPMLLQHPFQPIASNIGKQKLSIYSKIEFQNTGGNSGIGWEKFLSSGNSEMYKSRVKFFFPNPKNKDKCIKPQLAQDFKCITKLLVLKTIIGEKAAERAKHQKHILGKFEAKTSVYIAKAYQAVDPAQKPVDQRSIVMDYYGEGSMGIFLHANAYTCSLRTKMLLMPMIVQGMRVIRDCEVVHVDLKPQNVLIGRGLIARLTDFGESSCLPQDQQKRGFTLPYTAPELFISKATVDVTSGKKIRSIFNSFDTYSFGVLLDHTLRNEHILPLRKSANASNSLQTFLKQEKYPNLISFCPERYLDMFPAQVARVVFTLILLCLHPNPKLRPNQDALAVLLMTSQKFMDATHA